MLLERMVARQSVCLRRLGDGERAGEVGFGRLLANEKVTAERVIAGWSDQTAGAVSGRHVLAIQDTSEIHFKTDAERRRGLGEIGKGHSHGLLVHAMAAVDADSGMCLGLVGGAIYTRAGRVETPHGKRAPKEKESYRWIDTANQAKMVLAHAAMVTVVGDSESDIYPSWASLPSPNFHLLSRVMHDRAVKGGGTMAGVIAELDFVATRTVELLATPKRAARRAVLSLRFCEVEVARPDTANGRGQPRTVTLRLVEAIERNPPDRVEPVHWRLLTTHAVPDMAAAWQIVDWYRQRWIIEQLFRLLKTQGLKLEDSQLASAESLLKLAAVATKAAAVILQLVQARDGARAEPAEIAFSAPELPVLDSLNSRIEARSKRLKNPHPHRSLAWAAWIIGRLGGWDGYPSSKPPGPITMRHGFEYFRSIATGWTLRDLCMP